MEQRTIGSLQTTVVGLGCNNFGWRIDASTTRSVVDAALDAGINFFDTADSYDLGNSELFLSDALGPRRKHVFIATKFGTKMGAGLEGAQPNYLKQAVDASLRRLKTDYIDLYQLHNPDPRTPIVDTLGALDDLVRAGKVREIGGSNFTMLQINEADTAVPPGGARFVSIQNHFSLLHQEPMLAGVLDTCIRRNLVMLPYFPLANGLLTGKYRRGQPLPAGSRGADAWGPKVFTEENLTIVEQLIDFARLRNHTLLELAFSWLAMQPTVASIIAGATRADQIRANAGAAGWKLTAADLSDVQKIVEQKRE